MKKIFLLALLLLVPIITFASVAPPKKEASQNREKEILNLKEKFGIKNEYDKFSVEEEPVNKDIYSSIKFLKDRAKSPLYIYNWNSKDKSLSISVNEGKILSYRKNFEDRIEFSNKIKSYKKEDILRDVKNFFKKADLNYEDFSLESFYIRDGYAELSFNKKIGEFLFPSYNIFVTYDLHKSEVVNFNLENEFPLHLVVDSDFEKVDNPISREKARQIFNEKEDINLSYLVSDKDVKLVYNFKNPKSISLKDGALIDDTVYGVDRYAKAEDAKKEALSFVESNELNKIKDLKSKDEAKKIAAALMPKGSNFENISLRKANDKYIYSLSYVDKKNQRYSSIEFDAKTLKLESLYLDGSRKTDGKKLEKDELKKIALDFVKKYSTTEELNFEKIEFAKNNVNYLHIPRYVNGIPVINDGVNIEINPATKSVVNFNRYFSNVNFPKIPKDIISQKEASDIFFEKTFIKKYIVTPENIAPVYGQKNSYTLLLDVKGDNFLDYSGNIQNESTDFSYKGEENSKYKDEIKALNDFRIGLRTNKALNDEINYEEMVKLLLSIDRGDITGIDDYDYKVLKIDDYEKLKEKVVPKNIFLRTLLYKNNYYFIDDLKDVFKDGLFEDEKSLSAKDKKYFSFAKSIGIIDENRANAMENITLEEALHMVYRSLN